MRGGPAGPGTARLLLEGAGSAKGRAGGVVAHAALERTEPQEGSSRGSRFATRFGEEHPEVVTNDVGGALEANKALLVEH